MGLTQNIPARKLRYNNFPLHHTHDTTGRIGKLIPVQAMPVVAGDLIDEKIEFNIRMSPLSAPAMARFNVHFHSFYVPYRILTPRNGQETTWEKFILSVGQSMENVPALPHFRTDSVLKWDDMKVDNSANTVVAKEVTIGSLWDYLKLPVVPLSYSNPNAVWHIPRVATGGQPGLIALNFLAYLKIWNDWYRRDQIEEEIVFPLNLGSIDLSSISDSFYVTPELPENVSTPFDINVFVHELMKLRTRNYERDYFTSALPEPQFGDDVFLGGGDLSAMAGASIALSAQGPISGFVGARVPGGMPSEVVDVSLYNSSVMSGYQAIMGTSAVGGPTVFGFGPTLPEGQSGIPFDVTKVDGLQATPFSINELRLAMQIQGVREKINRGGTRYVEIMKSIYGVSVSDLRLQRPQYLGGIKAPISIGAVLQTSESATTPQGTLTGQGGTVGGQRIFRTKRIFEEAGVVMTIMSITPRTGYTGGIERQYLKFDPLDYYTPDFDHLGEQETYRAELAWNMLDSDDIMGDDVYLGYNPRYEEYKAAYSTCTGEFRNTLDNWNVYRQFDTPPVLSPEFIHAEPEDFDRLFEFENIQNTSNEHFQAQIYFDIKAKRPMSKYSTPFTFF